MPIKFTDGFVHYILYMCFVYCFVAINDTAEKEIMGKPNFFFRDDSLKSEKGLVNLT